MITHTRSIQTPDGLYEFYTTYLDDDYNPVDDPTQWQNLHQAKFISIQGLNGQSVGYDIKKAVNINFCGWNNSSHNMRTSTMGDYRVV